MWGFQKLPRLQKCWLDKITTRWTENWLKQSAIIDGSISEGSFGRVPQGAVLVALLLNMLLKAYCSMHYTVIGTPTSLPNELDFTASQFFCFSKLSAAKLDEFTPWYKQNLERRLWWWNVLSPSLLWRFSLCYLWVLLERGLSVKEKLEPFVQLLVKETVWSFQKKQRQEKLDEFEPEE